MDYLRRLQVSRFELIAFLTGASVMVLEIVGARLIAPQFGTSTYVWTAMIGVILGSLAVGYALGGVIADKDKNVKATLSLIIFIAAIAVLVMGMFQERITEVIGGLGLDLRIGALFAAIVLFGLPSLFIGMVSPHLAKVQVTSLERSGHAVGRLEAAGALGSIAGTFLCGYFLLSLFGSRIIIVGVVVVLLLTSFIAAPKVWGKPRRIGLLLSLVLLVVAGQNPPNVLADIDSPYARYKVLKTEYGGYPAHVLVTDSRGAQSAAVPGRPDVLLFDYIKRFQRAAEDYGDPREVMVIGGGTYTFPSSLIRSFSHVRVDAVEIDAALLPLARQYFDLAESPRLQIRHADGRFYLKQAERTYDLIYMDAFSSLSPPFQLTTREAAREIRDRLKPTGAVVVNVIGSYDDGSGAYLRALQRTYQDSFRYVGVYQADGTTALGVTQNFILYATNDTGIFNRLAPKAEEQLPLSFKPGGLLLTDDYAPIERLTF